MAARNDLTQAAALIAEGRLKDAEIICRSLVNGPAASGEARILLGKILDAGGQYDAAQSEFRAAVQEAPGYAEAWLAWAGFLRARGHPQKAADCLHLALDHVAGSHAIYNDLALARLALDMFDDAEAHLQKALEIDPRSAVSWCNLGIVRGRRGNMGGAAAGFRAAIAIDHTIAVAHNGLGEALQDSDPDAAADAFHEALRVRPGYAEALDNLGAVAFFKGDLPGALRYFEQALNAAPGLLRAQAHTTTALFMQGRLPEAWHAYRRRFEVEGLKHDPHGRFPNPIWHGESLKDKALLIWTELGLGEEVLQAGMFHDALGLVSKLTVECSPRLEGLFRRSFPAATIIPRLNPARAYPVPIDADYQIAGGDLGALFRDDWAKFPRHSGYLIPDVVKAAALRQRYAKGRFVVGLAWASKGSKHTGVKSLALAAFAPVLRIPGAVFVSLQHGAGADEIAAVCRDLGVNVVVDPEIDPAGDCDAIAAQIAAMDLVISVSNTAVHMAGALNVPVWNIVPGHNTSAMWHWFYKTDTSPWYPSMKLYRREAAHSGALMERVAADLTAKIAAAGKTT